jgi:hypothetical protein
MALDRHTSHVTLISQGSSNGSLSGGGGAGVDTFAAIDTVGRVCCRQRDGVRMLSTRDRTVSGRESARDGSGGWLVLCLEIQVSTGVGSITREDRGLTLKEAMVAEAA